MTDSSRAEYFHTDADDEPLGDLMAADNMDMDNEKAAVNDKDAGMLT